MSVPEQYRLAGSTSASIVASVEDGVRRGRLTAGATLPTVRALAADLGVSPATVAKAYQDLRRRGVVVTAGRAGTRIRPRSLTEPRPVGDLVVPQGLVDLAGGAPDPALLPDYGPALRRLADSARVPVSYRGAGMVDALRDLAGSRLAADGVPVGAMTVTAGALDGIERLLVAHLAPGDKVAVEDPGWANVIDLVAALGLEPVPLPMDDDGPTEAGLRAALRRGVRAVVVTARAQNPTGAVIGARRAAGLRRVLAGCDVLLIEDDHAAELSPVPLTTMAGATASWAFLRSTSKPYGPDLRLAVLAGDPTTVARVSERMRLGPGWVSTLLQRLVVELWTDPAVRGTVATARDEYADRRSALVAALKARGIVAYGRTGINVWVPVGDETRTVTGLRDAGYAVAPGSLFRLASPPAVRITVGALTAADVGPLADAVARALHGPGRTFSA